MGYTITPYITEQEIRTRTKELAEQIKKDYEGKPILLISILKGAVVFLTDLMRALETEDVTIDFMVVSSYGHGTESNGHVKITKDLSVDIAGKDVLIVEDILDSGNTLSTIIEILRGRGVNSLRICSLLDKPSRRTTVVPLEYNNTKINILDTPGAFDFSDAVMEALRAADAAILVCSAKDGITVGFEKAWKYCEERNMPRFVYISKVDEENADYNATFEALREKYGNKIAPVVVPIWDGSKKITGIIDVLNKRAFEMKNLKRAEISVPDDKVSVIEEFNDALKESVAETDEALMDRFFEGDDFTYAEMIKGLHQGVSELSLFPVLCGSGVTCLGSLMLMDYIIDLLPNPMEGNYHKATTADGKVEEFVVSPGGI